MYNIVLEQMDGFPLYCTLGPVLNFIKGLGVSGCLISRAMKIVAIHAEKQ